MESEVILPNVPYSGKTIRRRSAIFWKEFRLDSAKAQSLIKFAIVLTSWTL